MRLGVGRAGVFVHAGEKTVEIRAGRSVQFNAFGPVDPTCLTRSVSDSNL